MADPWRAFSGDLIDVSDDVVEVEVRDGGGEGGVLRFEEGQVLATDLAVRAGEGGVEDGEAVFLVETDDFVVDGVLVYDCT